MRILAGTKLRVRVLARDITHGVRNAEDAEQSPIALAMRRALPRQPRLVVATCAVFVRDLYAHLPPEVEVWLDMYDQGYPVQPIKFDLRFQRQPDWMLAAGITEPRDRPPEPEDTATAAKLWLDIKRSG